MSTKKKTTENPGDVKKNAAAIPLETLAKYGKGGITVIACDSYAKEPDLAKSMACQIAQSTDDSVLLELINMGFRKGREFLNKKPKNLEVFSADTSHGAALVHAATKMALDNNGLTILSTLAPNLNDDLFEAMDECTAWQLLRDEANALGKNVSIILFSSYYSKEPTSTQLLYANTVYNVLFEDGIWSLKCIKSDKKELRDEYVFVEAPEGLVEIGADEY